MWPRCLVFLEASFDNNLTFIQFAAQEKIESATDVLKGILKPVVDDVEEIHWPPRDPQAIASMEKVTFHFLTGLCYIL